MHVHRSVTARNAAQLWRSGEPSTALSAACPPGRALEFDAPPSPCGVGEGAGTWPRISSSGSARLWLRRGNMTPKRNMSAARADVSKNRHPLAVTGTSCRSESPIEWSWYSHSPYARPSAIWLGARWPSTGSSCHARLATSTALTSSRRAGMYVLARFKSGRGAAFADAPMLLGQAVDRPRALRDAVVF